LHERTVPLRPYAGKMVTPTNFPSTFWFPRGYSTGFI
jgi:hypothetical protein